VDHLEVSAVFEQLLFARGGAHVVGVAVAVVLHTLIQSFVIPVRKMLFPLAHRSIILFCSFLGLVLDHFSKVNSSFIVVENLFVGGHVVQLVEP
jgi:hypothetical protein